ncbi:MAG: hypothetical protein R6V10_07780 [bacterium]
MPDKKTARAPQEAEESKPFQLSLIELAESSVQSELKPEDEFIEEFTALCQEPVEITLTRNRSSLISVHPTDSGLRKVRLQQAFRAADQRTIKALARYIHKPDKRTGRIIDEYIKNKQDLFESMARQTSRKPRIKNGGLFKKLDRMLKDVMKKYDLHVRGIKITWGRRSTVRGNHSIKFGSYSHHHRLITIHPALDSPEVPDYFVEYIIYHELLHAVFPPLPGSGNRRDIHSAQFKRYEKKFDNYEEALRFEQWFVKNRLQ